MVPFAVGSVMRDVSAWLTIMCGETSWQLPNASIRNWQVRTNLHTSRGTAKPRLLRFESPAKISNGRILTTSQGLRFIRQEFEAWQPFHHDGFPETSFIPLLTESRWRKPTIIVS